MHDSQKVIVVTVIGSLIHEPFAAAARYVALELTVHITHDP